MSFKDKGFSEASNPYLNPKNNSNSILQNQKKPKENSNISGMYKNESTAK